MLMSIIGVLIDTALGAYTSDVVYDDENVQQLDNIPTTALHRNVDLKVLNADEEGTLLVPSE